MPSVFTFTKNADVIIILDVSVIVSALWLCVCVCVLLLPAVHQENVHELYQNHLGNQELTCFILYIKVHVLTACLTVYHQSSISPLIASCIMFDVLFQGRIHFRVWYVCSPEINIGLN